MQENAIQVHAIARRDVPSIGAQVFDRHAQVMRSVTVEAQALMKEAHGKIMQAQFNKSLALCMIRDRGLYTQWGYETFADYVEGEWDFGYRQANRYAQIGEKITMMLTAAESEEAVDGQRVAGLLSGLGNSQWRQLVLLSDDELKKLAVKDEYIAPDGSVLTLSQISGMATKELKDQLKATRDAASAAKEQLKLKEAELAELKGAIGENSSDAGELILKLRGLEGEVQMLRGMQTKRDAATADVNEATKKIEEGLSVLRKYQPMKATDFEDGVLAEVMAEVGGRAATYAAKFHDLADRYNREHGKWTGER